MVKNKEKLILKRKHLGICEYCGNEYFGYGKRFCSKSCYGKLKRGFKPSIKTKLKMSKSKIEEKNPIWKGNDVQYIALHSWIRRRKNKPKLCEFCNKRKPYDLANISGLYKRDINDFEWLCRKCHMIKDERLKNLKLYNIKKSKKFKDE